MSQQPGMCCWLGDALWWLFQLGVGRKSRGVGRETEFQWRGSESDCLEFHCLEGAQQGTAFLVLKERSTSVCVCFTSTLCLSQQRFSVLSYLEEKKSYCYRYKKEIFFFFFYSPIETTRMATQGLHLWYEVFNT